MGKTFKKWKEALKHPADVETLKLDVKQLPRVTFPKTKPLPAEIGTLENLRTLEIRARNLGGLCPELASLPKLETLSISNSEVVLELGSVLASMPALRSLELYNVGLEGPVPLPPSLEVLNLQNNDRLDVEAWCQALAELPQLRELSLAESCPGDVPASMAKLPALRSLTLSQNGYQTFPAGLQELQALEELDLAVNQIEVIPDSISSLARLRALKLQANRIARLPDAMRTLTSLEVLWLGSNPLVEVPDWVGELSALSRVDLSATGLSDLPPSFTSLPLKQLFVDVPDNVLQELERRLPDCSITRKSTQDVQREVEGWVKFFGGK